MSYSIKKSTEEQMDLIAERYWKKTPQWQKNRHDYICFVATDLKGEIIGYLALEEKEIPIPPYGKDWFIITIRVLQPYRCRGIGSDLLQHALVSAQKLGIRNFQGSANPTKEAHCFWRKNGFCFFQYGKQHNDPSKEKEYGNYSHIIFRRVDEINICYQNSETIGQFRFGIANQEQLDTIFTDYITKECVKFYYDKKDKISGLIAIDKNGNDVGFITYLEISMAPPLTGNQWYIPYLYIRPEFRGKGAGKALIAEVIKRAKEKNIAQLLIVHPNEEIMQYWYDLGFDIFIFRYLFSIKNSKFPIGIGKNISYY